MQMEGKEQQKEITRVKEMFALREKSKRKHCQSGKERKWDVMALEVRCVRCFRAVKPIVQPKQQTGKVDDYKCKVNKEEWISETGREKERGGKENKKGNGEQKRTNEDKKEYL